MTTKTIQMYRTNLDGSETTLYPLTEAKYVTMDDGTTIEEALTNSDSSKYSPVIESSKAMFKVGEGDSVDLSESAIDGAYNSCVLKGKTMVNCIQEPSSQDVVLPYEFEDGQYVTINDTKESGALGVELKGNTLVNKIDFTNGIPNGTSSNKVDDTITVTQSLEGVWKAYSYKLIGVMYDKEYIVHWNSLTHQCQRIEQVIGIYGNNISTGKHATIQYIREDNNYFKFTIPSTIDIDTVVVRVHATTYDSLTNMQTIVKGLKVLEYQQGMENWNIPYFEGMTSCKMPILHTTGKNLLSYNEMFVSPFTAATPYITESVATFPLTLGIGGNHNHRGVGIKFKVEPNTTYTLSSNVVVPNTVVGVAFYKNESDTTNYNNKLGIAFSTNIEESTKTFTTPNECNWIVCGIYILYTYEQSGGTVVISEMPKLQLEKNTQATTYEPHKSSILSLPEEVVLRSLPNGVCDTFNTRTGVYTQRIEEIILNGEIRLFEKSCEDIEYYRVATDIIDNFKLNSCMVNNMLPVAKMVTSSTTGEFVGDHVNSHCIHIRLLSSKLSQRSVSGVQEYLQSNPITVQYELATPIVTKINLPSTLKSWNTTTHIYSEIPENTLYPTLSHSNPSYPVILKPSTKYSIVSNSYSNSHMNSAINFNLGGATVSTTVGSRVTTITTPSALSNELLTMSGRGNKLNNVMVIEGDVAGDEPYFEGICDCKSPILSNVGKNLFDANNQLSTSAKTWFPIKNNLSVNHVFSCGMELPYIEFYGANSIQDTKICYQNWDVIATFRNAKEGAVTSSKKYKYLIVAFDNNKQTLSDFLPSLQVEILEKTSYESYKSNILSANGDKIELTEDMFEQGGTITTVGVLYQNNKESNNARLRLKDIVKVKPNTTYRLKLSDNYQGYVQTYNKEKLSTSNRLVWSNDIMFTTTSSEQYAVISIRYTNNSSISVGVLNSNIITLSEVDKTIVLRSLPNGVCDTLNIETGEYVQRIGEVVKNNSTGFSLSTGGWENKTKVCTFEYFNPEGMKVQNANNKPTLNCDKVPSNTFSTQWGNSEGIESITQHSIGGIVLSITRDKLLTQDVDGLNAYLQSNPLTIQYELATPIVSTIDVQGFPYAYKDGHVQLSSGSIEQSLTPKVEYSLVANRNGQIEANTKSIRRHQDKLDDFEALILTQMIQTHYEKTLLQFDFEMQMMALGGE